MNNGQPPEHDDAQAPEYVLRRRHEAQNYDEDPESGEGERAGSRSGRQSAHRKVEISRKPPQARRRRIGQRSWRIGRIIVRPKFLGQ